MVPGCSITGTFILQAIRGLGTSVFLFTRRENMCLRPVFVSGSAGMRVDSVAGLAVISEYISTFLGPEEP